MMEYAPAHKKDDAYERENFWAKIVGNIGDNQKVTLKYFGDRADDVLYPRYMMDALYDDTDMFKAKNSKSKRTIPESTTSWGTTTGTKLICKCLW